MKKTIAGMVVATPFVLYALGEEALRRRGEIGAWLVFYGVPALFLVLTLAGAIWEWAIEEVFK